VRIDVRMPDLAATEGSYIMVKRWLIPEGARVKRGQVLLEVETDKATMEVESIVTGVLAETCVRPDGKVAVGEVIARIEAEP
jgi:pyruvate dehydrogenase E2 component (dihydrolipoamide acetyltransferase)